MFYQLLTMFVTSNAIRIPTNVIPKEPNNFLLSANATNNWRLDCRNLSLVGPGGYPRQDSDFHGYSNFSRSSCVNIAPEMGNSFKGIALFGRCLIKYFVLHKTTSIQGPFLIKNPICHDFLNFLQVCFTSLAKLFGIIFRYICSFSNPILSSNDFEGVIICLRTLSNVQFDILGRLILFRKLKDNLKAFYNL